MGKKARQRVHLTARAGASVALATPLPAVSDTDTFGDIGITADNLSYKPFDTLGAVGTQFFAGLISGEEYNPDLQGDELLCTTDRMWRSSPQIAALMAVVMLPLLEADWSIAAASDADEDTAVAQFVQDNLFGGLQRPFHAIMQGVLLEWLRDGFSVLEKVYSAPDPQDGLIRLRKLAPRITKSIYRWFPGQDDELDRIQQRVYVPDAQGISGAYIYPIIPASKLVVFTHMQEGNNWRGISLLRQSYKPWYMLDHLERLACVAAAPVQAALTSRR